MFRVGACRTVTFVGMAKAIAKAAGKEAKVVLYEPEKLGLGKGAKVDGFPFRAVHFFASSCEFVGAAWMSWGRYIERACVRRSACMKLTQQIA